MTERTGQQPRADRTAAAPPLWTPSPSRLSSATMTRYQRWLAEHRGIATVNYQDLWQWSVDDLDAFWGSIVDFFDLRISGGSGEVLAERRMPGARWFPGTTTSYAEHIFRRHHPDTPAITHLSELRAPATWTWADLRAHTAAVAGGLQAAGVGAGDRVAAYLPNIPETIAAFLACASLGAVWTAAAPEFGARSVVDRFRQLAPKVVLAVDGYRYGGREYDRRRTVDDIVAELPASPRLIRFGYLDGTGWEPGFLGPDDPDALAPIDLPFDHPLWVVYSSGTTGLPKPIVHSQGGMLVEQVKVANLHLDARADDRIFWFTTTGWMMWNFLVGVLFTDASIVLFDGDPGYPDLDRLWDLAEEVGVTCFGTSAAYLGACAKAGLRPAKDRDLRHLRSVGSTGSPLGPEGFRWVYETVGDDIWLFSTSGGTDLCTAFVGGVPTLPVHEGLLQARSLGAAVHAFDDDGTSLIGQVGELVITEPMPSMPIYFWNDPAGERYRESYFSVFPGVWRHGDWIEITPQGAAVIYGRSDSTVNRGGIRIGTSEIYRCVLALDAVLDALVVDLPHPGSDGWLALFVVLRPGEVLDETLRSKLRGRLRDDCSPRHAPDQITQIAGVPRTLSGKIVEVPVKRILMGLPVDKAVSRESLSNPEALDIFVEMAGRGRP